MPHCAQCERSLDATKFSKKQLSKGASRRCKACVDGVVASVEAVEAVLTPLQRSSEHKEQMFAALNQPTRKTAPRGFESVEAAEAAGWEWDADRGIWIDLSRKGAASIKDFERDFAARYSRTELDAMSMDALSAELLYLRSLRPSSRTTSSVTDRQGMTDEAVQLASECHAVLKNARRQKSGAEGTFTARACAGCGKLPEAGTSLKQCGRCSSVAYCSKECQAAHWPAHKPACKKQVEHTRAHEREGGDSSEAARREVETWFAQVPNIAADCAALAWKLRAQQPVLVVEGGTNARVAKVTVLTRDLWAATGQAHLWEPRFASPTFDTDRHYFCMVSRGATRPELPVLTPRILFPHPPEKMDAFVVAAEADQQRRESERLSGIARRPASPPPGSAPHAAAPTQTAPSPRPPGGGYRKRMPRSWLCDACNDEHPAGTECTWYDKHPQVGDFALCDACTRRGVTADSQAKEMCRQM